MDTCIKSITFGVSVIITLFLVNNAAHANDKISASVLRYVLCFKFKKDSKPVQIKKVESEFAALKNKITQIRGFEMGTNNSPEGLNKGYTHCFVVTFGSEKDRDAYLPLPAHQAFVKILNPILEEVFVIDYWNLAPRE